MRKMLAAPLALVFAALGACRESHGPPAVALTIQGTVLDAMSHNPIAQARVELQMRGCILGECPPRTVAVTTSDLAGHYELQDHAYCTENTPLNEPWVAAYAAGYSPRGAGPLLCTSAVQTFDVGLQPQP